MRTGIVTWERYRMEYAQAHGLRTAAVESIPAMTTLAAIRTLLQPGMDALQLNFEED